MAGVVGFEPTVHGIKTRGYCYQDLSGKSRKLLSKVLSIFEIVSFSEVFFFGDQTS